MFPVLLFVNVSSIIPVLLEFKEFSKFLMSLANISTLCLLLANMDWPRNALGVSTFQYYD